MKKIIIVALFTFIFIFPFKANAFSIDNVTTKGNSVVKMGDELAITLQATTSGYDTNEGIWIVYTNLVYDKTHLVLTDVSAPGYNTTIEYNDKGVSLGSIVIENSGISGMCVEGLLHCGTYTANLKFQIKDVTEPINSMISTSEFGMATLLITDAREYGIDDAIERTYVGTASHSLLLRPNTTTTVDKTPVPVPEKKAQVESTKKPTPVTKSSNNYLKSLEIISHNIDFNKATTAYEISVDNSVTSLDLKPIVEQPSASYIVNGNENLENGSIIKIIVTAENGQTKEYQLTIKKEIKNSETKNEEQTPKKENDQSKENSEKITRKVLMGIGGIIGVFVLIGLIFFISNIRENRKLDKLLRDDK